MRYKFHDDVDPVLVVLAVNIFDNVGVFECLHDFELIIELDIEDAILDETSLINLFCSVQVAFAFGLDSIDGCKSTFAQVSSKVVIAASIPEIAI